MSDADAYSRAGRPAPTEIRVKSEERRLEIDFSNGKSFRFPAEFLRVESPSAEVQGHSPRQKTLVPGKRQVAIAAIEAVGNYAVRIRFDDGHESGIYSWEYFYDMGLRQDAVWQAYLDVLKAQGLSRD